MQKSERSKCKLVSLVILIAMCDLSECYTGAAFIRQSFICQTDKIKKKRKLIRTLGTSALANVNQNFHLLIPILTNKPDSTVISYQKIKRLKLKHTFFEIETIW